MDDKELVKKTLNGDLESYGQLVQRYQSRVYYACLRVLANKDDAEDITQDVFLRSYDNLDRFDVNRPFGPWVGKIAVNMSINYLKKKRPISISMEEEHDQLIKTSPVALPSRHLEKKEQQERLQKAILTLPEMQRVVIELRHFLDLSYQEIADHLSIQVSDVKSYLFRARRKLAEKMEQLEEHHA